MGTRLEVVNEPSTLCCAPLTGADLSTAEAEGMAKILKALADPTRVRIVNLLANSRSPVCVCDINGDFDLSQPTISHHLKKLVSAGVLRREQRGTWAYFSIDHDTLGQLSNIFQLKKGKRP